MALRGKKPTPARLRLVAGTHRTARHGATDETEEKVEGTAAAFGALVKPSWLRGAAARAWKLYIAPAAWLDASREPAAIAFCELWKEFSEAPARFPSAKHGQMRAYMHELGLSDLRARGDAGTAIKDEFFDD